MLEPAQAKAFAPHLRQAPAMARFVDQRITAGVNGEEQQRSSESSPLMW